MLVLTHHPGQSTIVENVHGGVKVSVLEIRGGRARLGFDTPLDARVIRGEVLGEASPPQPFQATHLLERRIQELERSRDEEAWKREMAEAVVKDLNDEVQRLRSQIEDYERLCGRKDRDCG